MLTRESERSRTRSQRLIRRCNGSSRYFAARATILSTIRAVLALTTLSAPNHLTDRQKEVLNLRSMMSIADAAAQMGVAVGTASAYLAEAYNALDLRSSERNPDDALAKARSLGWI